jgi:hypothetical protein
VGATVKGDLLNPTLMGHEPRDWTSRLPWRLGSQVFVGFFGGPVGVTIVAALNGARLGLARRRIGLIVAIGLAATIAAVLVAGLLGGDSTRLLVQVAGVATAGPLHLLQRSADRVFSTFSPHEDSDDDHASLWGPGFAAVVAGWLVQAPLVVAVERL